MVGFITTRSLLTHPSLIVREFGMQCFVRCIWRTLTLDRNVTFLECIRVPPSSELTVSGSAIGIRDERSASGSWLDAFGGVQANPVFSPGILLGRAAKPSTDLRG
jgi:hypothetical protein